ncbi:biotin carboxyl carrier protein [Desulfocucumis palustris]|uniref:Biotin carboxyl carrier protein n=1 Tax=Desulfocucumis palustris TaxID=1898651 RepID=A0A2L2XFY3_9FIRM|nr:biotin/lipoyl-containing protein [Desulfocucumis palustris]GBF35259.1 biotin carboxyl carrier protein [Desulfocucumis palustris]
MNITSPMVGKLLSIDVKVGDKVKKNDVVATIEAMKMQVKVFAPEDGEVAAVNAAPDTVVNPDTVIVVLK